MTIHRKVRCENINCPHERLLRFSDWIRENLPDSKDGFYVSDIDFVFYNMETKKVIIVEQKTRGAGVQDWQRDLLSNIKRWILQGIDNEWIFEGIHLLQFEGYSFDDGKVYFDNKEITEQELIKILSL